MPCLSGQYQPATGPLVNVGVAKAGTFAASSPPSTITAFPALLDTGASRTCISPTVAKALGLHRTHLMKLIKSLGIDK